jgi:cystathionine beta-lyase family protein involved in aluminum resistance
VEGGTPTGEIKNSPFSEDIIISDNTTEDLIQQLLDEAGLDGISAAQTAALLSGLKAKRRDLIEAVESQKAESSNNLLQFARAVQIAAFDAASKTSVLPGSAIAVIVNFAEDSVNVTVPRISAKGIQTSYALNSDGSLVSSKEVERNKRAYTKRG